MAMMTYVSFLALVLLCLCNISFLNALDGSFSVEMIHRDSSRSPLYRPAETRFQRIANALRRSIDRADHLNRRFASPNTAESTVTADQGEYLMSYSIGTPPIQILGIVDTGSDIIWLQCKPCESCYKQTTPIFEPAESKTYKTLPCSSNICESVQSASCSSNSNTCEYTISYGDGSHSQGDLSVETLTLGPTDGSSIQFPEIVIGCGRSNAGTFEQGGGSGIVGLGGGPASLISQLSSSIKGKFSYCLTPMFPSQSKSSSKLKFGDVVKVSRRGTVTTPIVSQNSQVFYFLTLEGLSVGDNKIEFGSKSSSSSSDTSGDQEGNIIIDSGTTLTLLPDDVYSNLEAAVADAVKLKRVEDPSGFLSLCFKTSTSDKLNVPVITAHFKGADVELNAINTFVEVAEGVVCLAFRSSELSIFGNLAQQNLLVGYDLIKKTVSFTPTDCTKE